MFIMENVITMIVDEVSTKILFPDQSSLLLVDYPRTHKVLVFYTDEKKVFLYNQQFNLYQLLKLLRSGPGKAKHGDLEYDDIACIWRFVLF